MVCTQVVRIEVRHEMIPEIEGDRVISRKGKEFHRRGIGLK